MPYQVCIQCDVELFFVIPNEEPFTCGDCFYHMSLGRVPPEREDRFLEIQAQKAYREWEEKAEKAIDAAYEINRT